MAASGGEGAEKAVPMQRIEGDDRSGNVSGLLFRAQTGRQAGAVAPQGRSMPWGRFRFASGSQRAAARLFLFPTLVNTNKRAQFPVLHTW